MGHPVYISFEMEIVKKEIFLYAYVQQQPCWCVTSIYQRSQSHTARCVTIVYCLVTNFGPACGTLSDFRLAALRCYKRNRTPTCLIGSTSLDTGSVHVRISLRFCFDCFSATGPQSAWASSFARFLVHTQRRTTVGRTHLDE